MKIGDRVRYVGPARGFVGTRRVTALMGASVEVELIEDEDIVRGRTPAGKESRARSNVSTRSTVYPLWALKLDA